MDYSHTAGTFFPGAPPYQFMGAQVPLTPSHTNSVASDDFSANRSPPEIFDQYPNVLPTDQFQNFDNNYVHQYNTAQAFPGPPTPPGQIPGQIPGSIGVHPVTAATTAAVAPAAVPAVTSAIHQPGHASDLLHVPKPDPEEQQSQQQLQQQQQQQSRRQGSSEEEDPNPAQSRRKAQNRAAQRAFRERKERHVKDLESRLQQLEQVQADTASENERLKRDLQRMETENEILRATSMAVAGGAGAPAAAAVAPTTTGPMSYNPTDFYSNVLQGHANKTPSHRIVISEKGERLLGPGATWDFIINHELFRNGRVDVSLVSERLRPQAKCDGQGPVFEESAIIQAIEMSVSENSDELI